MLDELAAVEAAALDPTFLGWVLERHRAEAHVLLANAARDWIADGCPRYSDHETACTAGFVGFIETTVRNGRATALQIAVFLEGGEWTEAHLSGEADPSTVPRPDIALFLGVHHDVRMSVECKRLLDPYATARDYVLHGLLRFISGKYSTAHGPATLIAFLLDRGDEQACRQINDVIREHLDDSEVLSRANALGPLQAVYRSRHQGNAQPFDALHLLLDLQTRPEPRPRASCDD